MLYTVHSATYAVIHEESMNRIERYSLLAASTAISLFALASPVAATVIEYESQAGATSPTDGRPLGATATFTYDATCLTNCELTIELANTEPMTGISQALTDFHFTSTSITGLTLTGADGEQFVNCYHEGVNKPDQYCDAPTNADFDANSYGWTLTGSYVLAATPLTDSGIISMPIDPNSDGVSNSQHNPWLIGPVDFFFSYNGAFSVSNVAFSFGTDANTPTVPGDECRVDCSPPDQNVPEPASVLLLASAAIAAGLTRRRRRH